MMKKIALALFFAGVLLVTTQSDAQAQNLCNNIRSGNNIIGARPPYFALHPPVYYDRVVSRAYGISPFAVPPGVMPVENSVPSPKTVSNPFYKKPMASMKQEAKTKKPINKVIGYKKSTAKKVNNPFYVPKVAQAG